MFFAVKKMVSHNVGDIGISLVFGCQNFFPSVMLVILGMLVMSVILHVFWLQN